MFRTALRFIIFDKPKTIGAIAGTVISVFLIGQQCGIFIFLINAMSSAVSNNSQYIWVVDDKTTNVSALAQLDTRIGYELKSIPGVKEANPMTMTPVAAKFEGGKSSGLVLIGVQAPVFAGGPWNIFTGAKDDLVKDNAVATDFFDSKALGDLKVGEYFEINGKKVVNAVQTKGVKSFGGVYAFTTIERARYLGNIPTNKASAFLVTVNNKADEQAVINKINGTITGVKAWTSKDFAKASIMTVLATSGIALSFGTLIVFAIIVGFVIIGLTLYSAAIDRIKDYGTLKAIGANNRYIARLIATQAIIIALLGYALGTLLVEAFKSGVAKAGTIFDFPIWLRVSFFFIIVFIALFGSLFAIRRITSLEPAQVFRG